MPDKLSNHHNKTVFLWVFCALNMAFAFYQATFFIGNHDWDWVKGTTQVLSLETGLFEGRYAKFILNVFLFGGQVLPLLNTQIAFALLAWGCVLLVEYWRIKQPITRVMVAMLPALSPFILGWLYFPINILGNFAAVPLVVGGLILAEKASIIHKSAAGVCFLLALGVYPSTMEMMIVCWSFRWLLNPPETWRKSLPSAMVIFLSLVMFKLLLLILTKLGVIYSGHYNLQTAGLTALFTRLPEMALLAVKQLWVTLPFFPIIFKVSGLLLLVGALFCTIRSLSSVGLWLIAVFATVLSAFLTAVPTEVAYMPRVNFYGVNFLYAGAATVLLSSHLCKIRNLGLILSLFYLLISVNQNCEAQKVWQLGKQAEENLVARISTRILEKENNIPLTAVIAGELPLRPKYYAEKYEQQSPYILNTPFIVRHIPSGMFNFYAVSPLFAPTAQIAEITPELYAFIKNADTPYPSVKGLFVDERYAIILLTDEGIRAIQAQLP